MADPVTAKALSAQHRAEALAARLPDLLVAAERIAATVMQGVHGRRRVGVGESFWQFRPYDSTDPVTRIDWRASAKTERVYVRETEWSAAQSIWLWRDGSASMNWRSKKELESKRDRADLVLLALSLLLVGGGERVALMGAAEQPRASRRHVERMALAMVNGSLPAESLPPPLPLPRNAKLVLASDFLQPLDQIHAACHALAERDLSGHLLHILDPAEELLPFAGRIRFRGLEGEGDELVPRVETLRGPYAERIAAQREGVRAIARQLGWSYAAHRTDAPAQPALLALYMAMSQGEA